jgi:hypothetical protein
MKLKKSIAEGMISCLVFFLFVLAACQGIQTTIAPENRIALLQGGPHTGSWESIDVFLEYQYAKQPGTIKLNIGGHAKRKYDQLSVWVRFLDAQGKILETKSVYNSGFRQKLTSRQGRIEKTFELPMGTTQFAFQSTLKTRERK